MSARIIVVSVAVAAALVGTFGLLAPAVAEGSGLALAVLITVSASLVMAVRWVVHGGDLYE